MNHGILLPRSAREVGPAADSREFQSAARQLPGSSGHGYVSSGGRHFVLSSRGHRRCKSSHPSVIVAITEYFLFRNYCKNVLETKYPSGIWATTIVCPRRLRSPRPTRIRSYLPGYPSQVDHESDRLRSFEFEYHLAAVRQGVPDQLGPTRSAVGQRLDPPPTGVAQRHRGFEGAIAPFPSAEWMLTFPPRSLSERERPLVILFHYLPTKERQRGEGPTVKETARVPEIRVG